MCVLIEISMEIGMLNFLSGIIGHCTEGKISLYFNDQKFELKGEKQDQRYRRLDFKSSSVQGILYCRDSRDVRRSKAWRGGGM